MSAARPGPERSDPRRAHFDALAACVLDSPGELPPRTRRALAGGDLRALAPAAAYLAKVSGASHTTTGEEVAALASTVGEEAVYEATIAVAFGQAERQVEAALALLGEDS